MPEITKKKKLLVLSDDIRVPSGVGTMTKRIVMGLKDEFDIIQLGGAIKHGDPNPVLLDGIKVIPVQGYGNSHILRNVITAEQPDIMMIFTDPRYWIWLWQIEDEIRSMMPLMYYHLWDDAPAPKYNRDFYLSNDWIGAISKISKNLVEEICPEFVDEPWHMDYIPHGTPTDVFKPIDKEDPLYKKFLREYYKEKYEDYEFIVLYNNRNVRRKMMGDVMTAYNEFVMTNVPEDKRDKCLLLMHTHVTDDNGTNLAAIKQDLYPHLNILFSEAKVKPEILNYIYNSADVTINLSSNEGYGMATAESLMSGTPIITTITGGLQDQLNIDFEGGFMGMEEWKKLISDGTQYLTSDHAVGIIPKSRSLQGSPPTPYIYDDRISWVDAAEAINYWYTKTKDERDKAGQSGREYLISQGHTVDEMNKRFKNSIKSIFENWKPIKRVNVEEC